MHALNHPYTKHLCESVWDVDPIEVTGNQPVGLVWLSPDCKHFSKAKGGTPVSKQIRGLAWVGMRWIALIDELIAQHGDNPVRGPDAARLAAAVQRLDETTAALMLAVHERE